MQDKGFLQPKVSKEQQMCIEIKTGANMHKYITVCHTRTQETLSHSSKKWEMYA